MALIMNDLEMNVELNTSEMADVNGGDRGWEYRRPPIGVASADALAGALGKREAFTFTSTFSEVDYGHALATSESHSFAS